MLMLVGGKGGVRRGFGVLPSLKCGEPEPRIAQGQGQARQGKKGDSDGRRAKRRKKRIFLLFTAVG